MRDVRIAHLADFHVSREYRRGNLRNVRRTLDHVLRMGVDHVVVTGDITANAEDSDFQVARQLFSSFGLLDAKRLTVTIGNHDVFGGVHTAEDVLHFPGRCRGTDYAGRILSFKRHFEETFEGVTYGGSSSVFPFAKRVGDVVLFAVNSIAPHAPFRNPLGSNGEVSNGEIRRLERLLSSRRFAGLRRVVLIHHHFHTPVVPLSAGLPTLWGLLERQTMKLRGKDRLIRMLAKWGVESVLHGHHHKTETYQRNSIQFSNAGGTVLGPEEGLIAFNLLTVRHDGIETQRVHLPSGSPGSAPVRPVNIPVIPSGAHQAA